MKTLSDKVLILMWLTQKAMKGAPETGPFSVDIEVTNADIEAVLPHWGAENYKLLHTPGTYSRAFRRIRQSCPYDLAIGERRVRLSIIDISDSYPTRKTSTFRVHFEEVPHVLP